MRNPRPWTAIVRMLRIAALPLLFALAVAPAALAQALSQLQGPNLGTHTLGDVYIQLNASGGNGSGSYTWSVIAGDLPPGVSLRTDFPSWYSPAPDAGLIGVATTPGTYTFTLRVTSGGQTADRVCTIKINTLLMKDQYSVPDAFVGVPYWYTLTAIDNAGPLTWTPTSGPPAGLELNTDGVLSGTPTASGSYYVPFRVTDGVDTVFDYVYVRVYDIQITTPRQLPHATQYEPYSVTLEATGGTGPYTFTSSDTSPFGLTLDPSGLISGTPTGTGQRMAWFTVTDSNRVSYSTVLALDTIGVPPALPSIGLYHFADCPVGLSCTRGISVSYGGMAPFTWTAVGLPPGMSIREALGNEWDDAEMWGTPTQAGTFNVQVTATDAQGFTATSAVFPLHVSPLVDSSSLPSGGIGTPYSGKLYVLGGRGPYTVTALDTDLPIGVTFDPATFVISGTPLESGYFYPSYRFTDANGDTLERDYGFSISGGASSTIYIYTSRDLGTAVVGSSFSRQLSACCVPSYAWSVSSGALPPGLSLSADGRLGGTPTTAGAFGFFVTAADAVNSANAAVRYFTLKVLATQPPTPSISTSSLPFGNIGSAYGITLAASGGTGALTWSLMPYNYLPPGLTLAPNGVLSGTPRGGGQFRFTVKVVDEANQSTTRYFILSIYPPGEAPPLSLSLGPNLGPYTYGSRQFSLLATGGVPPYHYSLTPGAAIVPGMRVQDGQPLPSGWPATAGAYLGVLDTPGAFPTSIRVTDSSGLTLDRRLTVTVTPLRVLSQSQPPNASVGVPYSFTLVPFGGSGNYSWTLTSSSSGMPPGIAVSTAGQVTGTPTAAGNYFPAVTLTDLTTSSSISFSFTIVVDPFDIATSGVLPRGIVGTPYTYALLAPGCAGTCAWSGFPPGGLTLSADGVISGTPTFATNTSFTVTAIGSNGSVSKIASLQVLNNIPQPLSISTSASLGFTTIGSTYSLRLGAAGGTPPYAWSLRGGSLPPGVTLEGAGEVLGRSFSPGFAYLAGVVMQSGEYAFTLAVTDGAGTTVTRAFTWTVTPLALGYSSLPVSGSGNPLVYDTPFAQPLLASGGTNNFVAWASTVPMPPGLELDPATGVVSGRPSNTGNFSIPIQVTDDAGQTTRQNISFNIASPTGTTLGFTSLGSGSTSLVLAPALGATSINVTPTGGTGPYTMTALTELPPGFVLASGDAVFMGYGPGSFALAGTPLASGTFSITLRADDSLGNIGVRTVALRVAPFQLFSATLADASLGVPYSRQLVAFDNTGSVTWSVSPTSTLPPGITVSATGEIGGMPTQVGTFTFGLTATDESGIAGNYSFTLLVSGISVADGSVLPSATEGVPYAHRLTGSGGSSTLVWSANGLPSGLTLSGDGVLGGTPTTSGGPFHVVVTVTDGVVPLTRRFALSVRSPNPAQLDVPITSTTLADVTVGQSISTVSLSASGGVPPYSWDLAPGSTLPPGIRLVSGSTLPPTSTPGSSMLAGVPSTTGPYTFDLIATDAAGAQVRRTYRLNVSAIGIVPGSPATAIVGSSYAQRLVAVGGSSPYTFTMTPVSSTQDMLPGGLALSADGLISGVPTSTGYYSFVINVRDTAGHAFARTYSLTVTNAFGLLVSSVPPWDTWVGSALTTTLTVTGGASSYNWSVVSGSLPPGLVLTQSAGNSTLSGWLATAGTFTYTLRAVDVANSDNFADRVFTHRVSPAQLVAPPVRILAVRDLPGGQVNTPYEFTLKAAGGTPPYTFTESPDAPLPPGLTLSGEGVLSGTPQAVGRFSVSPVIADSAGHTAVTPFALTLVVSPAGKPSPLVHAGSATLSDASVGVPYAFALDAVLRGGTAPFSWSVTAGATLPAGLAVLTGANGVTSYLGGVPSAPGNYPFSLHVTDSSGQTLTSVFTLKVSVLSLTPDALPPGRVGMPYSSPLVPAGGSSPYSLALAVTSDMPPGLSLSPAGVLSGTPTVAGSFLLALAISDGAGNTLMKTYPVTIDNAAGEAPALSLAPRPIAVYHTIGSAAPAPLPVAVASTSGSLPFNAMVAGIPGASLSAGGGTTSTTLMLNLDVASLAAGVYTGVLAVKAPDAANLSDVVPVTLTVTPAPPCTYTVDPATTSVPAEGAAGSFSVSAGPGCSWVTTGPPPSLVQITAGANGRGVGTVSYSVAPNRGPSARTLTIMSGGQPHTITQFGSQCSFAISPARLTAPAAGGLATITITPSARECGWTASGLGAAPASGTGGGTATVTIPPNLGVNAVTLTAVIAGKTLTVAQTGIGCSVGLSPYTASPPAGGGQGVVEITTPAGCNYETSSGASWISVTSGGSGAASGTLVYSVEPNSTTQPRSASLNIGGQTFLINQAPLPCSVTVNTAGLGSPFGPSGTTGTIGVTTNGANCTWTALSGDAWATVTPSSGTGNGTIGVTVGSNAGSTSARATALTVGGQTVQIQQAGTTCSYGLQSATGTVPAAGGNGSVGVITAGVCAWTATSNDPGWLTIVSSGTAGSTDVRFVAQPNASPTPRTGTLTVAGSVYTVTQAAGSCLYILTAPGTSTSVSRDGATGAFGFTTTAAGCSPNAVSYVSWISTALSFDGASGTVTYVVAPNPSGATRVGSIQVGEQSFTISQMAASCAYSLNRYGAAFSRFGGAANFLGSPSGLGCTPVTGTDQPSFIFLGPLAGPELNLFTQPYTVAPFDLIGGGGVRTGRITFGGQFFTVKQTPW